MGIIYCSKKKTLFVYHIVSDPQYIQHLYDITQLLIRI